MKYEFEVQSWLCGVIGKKKREKEEKMKFPRKRVKFAIEHYWNQ